VELDVRRLDVTDQASITTCVDGVVADHGHLDVVGYTEASTTPGIVKDGAGTPTGELQEPPAMAPLLSMMAPDTADVLARGIGVGDPCLG
jgi:NAD(P)-dependent dehydrogenase (short-subunit alcohol dehydrogenase family)